MKEMNILAIKENLTSIERFYVFGKCCKCGLQGKGCFIPWRRKKSTEGNVSQIDENHDRQNSESSENDTESNNKTCNIPSDLSVNENKDISTNCSDEENVAANPTLNIKKVILKSQSYEEEKGIFDGIKSRTSQLNFFRDKFSKSSSKGNITALRRWSNFDNQMMGHLQNNNDSKRSICE